MNKNSQLKKMPSLISQSLLISKTKSSLNPLIRKKTHTINYKNIFLLRKYISIEGKILPRRLTTLSSKKQRYLAKAIKNARIIGFLPFVRQVLY